MNGISRMNSEVIGGPIMCCLSPAGSTTAWEKMTSTAQQVEFQVEKVAVSLRSRRIEYELPGDGSLICWLRAPLIPEFAHRRR